MRLSLPRTSLRALLPHSVARLWIRSLDTRHRMHVSAGVPPYVSCAPVGMYCGNTCARGDIPTGNTRPWGRSAGHMRPWGRTRGMYAPDGSISREMCTHGYVRHWFGQTRWSFSGVEGGIEGRSDQGSAPTRQAPSPRPINSGSATSGSITPGLTTSGSITSGLSPQAL